LRGTVLALALAVVACREEARPRPGPARPPAGGRTPNVVLITIDTLRADHLGAYGYARPTSPRFDALAKEGTLFERAYTYWPKTRGSFAIMLTGRYPSANGYSKSHPALLDMNPTLASVLAGAGYATAAFVDNANVAAHLGFAKGFGTYFEAWQHKELASEMDRARAITAEARRFLRQDHGGRPFFLWVHYVNPHAPYAPPPPFDTAFLDPGRSSGARLPVVPGFHGGIPKQWAVAGKDRLTDYVAQYDGEIAAADQQAGEVLDELRAAGHWAESVIVLTSDHGESLGEHDYYFDHGEDLFDPCLEIPLVLVVPGEAGGRRSGALASTLDLVPTILDAVKVSYPAGLVGVSLLPATGGRPPKQRPRIFAQNERNLSAVLDERYKLVATPSPGSVTYALYDRVGDPGETSNVLRRSPQVAGALTRELLGFLDLRDREWERTRGLLGGARVDTSMSPQACEQLKAMGYVERCP
jgi:arylsulfatase A-like enzyme